MGLAPYRHLSVHGYWNVDERKVSKSLGNKIDPLLMRGRYGFEAFRYYLLREMSFGFDAEFSEAALVQRANADLANNLGNLLSRTLNLVEKLCGGDVPEPADVGLREQLDAQARALAERAEREMGELRFHEALTAILAYSDAVNRQLDAEAPWKAAKQPGGEARVRSSLYAACNGLRQLSLLLAAFLPEAAAEIAARLGLSGDLAGARWSDLWQPLAPGGRVGKGAPLFPRLEPPAGAS
jgi:methionyl-tRNA synthetase